MTILAARHWAVLAALMAALASMGASPIAIKNDFPPLPMALRGRAFGTSGGAIIAAGGIDQNGKPVDRGDVLPPGAKSWNTFNLDDPRAFAACASADDSTIVIGGVGPSGAEASVLRSRWTGRAIQTEQLPQLPAPRVMASATTLGNIVYVFGGEPDEMATRADDTLLALDLRDLAAGWKNLGACPGGGRLSPTIVAQYESVNVFGGRTIDGALLHDIWIYRPKPLDGTTRRGWIRGADIPPAHRSTFIPKPTALPWENPQTQPVPPAALERPAAFASGQAHVILMADEDVLAYHCVTDSWTSLGRSPLPGHDPMAIKLDRRNLLISDNGAVATIQITPVVRSLHLLDYLLIAVYFAGMASIGIYFSRRQTSSGEFALGGRRTKWWVAAISLYATSTSAISFMAIPAQAYATNLVFLMISVANGLLIIPQAYLAIPLIRRLNVTSTYEYLERRFSPALRLLASAQCIIFQTAGRMSVVILLPALAIAAVTGLNVFYCVIIMGTLTTFYTAIGGIDAVMWTDVAQASLMFIGPLVAIGVMLFSFHRPADLFAIDWHYSKFRMAIFSWDWTTPVIWIFLIDGLARVAGFAGDQTMVQRVLATPGDREARRATLWSWIIGMTSAIIFQFMGVAFFAYFHAHPEKLDVTMNNDQVLPLFVVQSLPAGIAGLIIAGLFAGSMSTLSGTMNSVATLIVEDFYRRLRPESSDRTRLRLMKRFSYIVGSIGTAIALVMAALPIRSMFQTWNNIIALLGGGFLGMYTLGLFSRRASTPGVMIGAVASLVITACVKAFTPLHWALYTPIAILSCIVTGYLTSLVLPDKPRDLNGLTVYTSR